MKSNHCCAAARRRCATCVSVVVLVAGAAFGGRDAEARGGVSDMPTSRALSVPRMYQDLSHVRVTWLYRMANPDQSVTVRHSTTSAASDGRFGYVNYDGIEGRPAPGDKFAKYFVFGEGRNLWCAYAEGSRYTETTLSKERDVLDPAPQMGLAPWARVNAWLDEMEKRGIAPVPLGAGVRFVANTAENESCALEFGANGELVALELGFGGTRSRWEYSDFREIDGRRIPSRLREYREITKDGAPVIMGEGVARLEKFECNTPEVLESVRFDPARLNVRYFEESTGDVYSADKSRKLFTINQEGRAISAWWSRTWLMGVIGAAAASLGIVWKKWPRR